MVVGDATGDKQPIPRLRGNIETGDGTSGALTHNVLGASGGEAIVVRGPNLQECEFNNEIDDNGDAVSYTHLTLPTKRIV